MTEDPILYLERPGRPLEVCFAAGPGREHFDQLVTLLEVEHSATVRQRFDGAHARRWVLEKEGRVLELWHDDVAGNSLVAATPGSEAFLRRLGQDLGRRLTSRMRASPRRRSGS